MPTIFTRSFHDNALRMPLEGLWLKEKLAPPFATVVDHYQLNGGITTADLVAQLLNRPTEQAIAKVAQWIVDRNIIVIEYHRQFLLPLFQFDFLNAVVRGPVRETVHAMKGDHNNASIARWFATPQFHLQGKTPVEVVRKGGTSLTLRSRWAEERPTI